MLYSADNDEVDLLSSAIFLAENLPIAIFLFDETIRFANPALARLSGYRCEELVGLSPSHLFRDSRQTATGLAYGSWELPLVRKDGSRVWIELHTAPLAGNGATLSLAQLSDISRRKVMEQSLQMMEKAVETTQIGITITDSSGTILHTNPAEAEMHGYQVEELIGQDVRILAPRELWNPMPIKEMFIHKQRRRESLNVRRCGTVFPVLLLSDLVNGPEGQPTAVVTTCLDMSEQYRADCHRRMLEKALQETQIGVTITDLDGRILYTNPAEAEMHGYQVEDLLGADVRLFAPCHLWQPMQSAERRYMRRHCRETINVRKDGSEFPVRLLSDLVTDGDGEPIAVVATCEDITDRRCAEEEQAAGAKALEASASISSLLLENPDPRAVVPEILETLGRAADASRCYWFDISDEGGSAPLTSQRAEWCAPGIEPQIDSPDRQRFRLDQLPHLLDVLRRNEVFRGPVKDLPAEERQAFALHGIRSVLLIPLMVGERLTGFIGFDDCVSERHWHPKEVYLLRASAHSFALAMERWQSRQRLRRLASAVEQAAEGLAIFDLDGRRLYANEAFSKMAETRAGERLAWLFDGSADDPARLVRRERLAAGRIWREVAESEQPDGTTRHDQITLSPMHDDQGKLVGYSAVHADISERMRLQQQLLLAQRMEAVGQLAGGIAHDFNNMITAILGTASLLRLQAGDAVSVIAEGIDTIEHAAHRAAELTRGLLTFARRQPLQREDVDLNTVVTGMQPILRSLVSESTELQLCLVDRTAMVSADRGQLEQALINLCLNARDAMQGGGTITISTRHVQIGEEFLATRPWGAPGPYVLLEVEDTGVGMDERTCSRVFEPFYTTKQPGSGTGLGLAIVYGVIKQHEGMIDVSSTPGAGTAFSIFLPALDRGAEQPKQRPQLQDIRGSGTILIVEDESHLRRMLERVFTELGYVTLTAADGVEGLEQLASAGTEIDLVLTDLVMPRLGGRELYDQGSDLAPDAVFLFTSGYEEVGFRKAHFGDRSVSFLAKPYDLLELVSRVRELLDQRTL